MVSQRYFTSEGYTHPCVSHADLLQELYEPLWDELYQKLKAKDIRIRNIWIADVAHQGASGALNEKNLGNDRGCSTEIATLKHGH